VALSHSSRRRIRKVTKLEAQLDHRRYYSGVVLRRAGLYPGLDLSAEIGATHAQGLGDIVLIEGAQSVAAFAVCHHGPRSEAGADTCFIKFGAVRDSPAAEQNYLRLLDACEALAINTVGQKVGPLSMVDESGAPFSQALHVIERYRLIDGILARDLQQKHESTYFGGPSPFTNEYWRGDIDPDTTKQGLQVEFIVDNPATFTQSWSGRVTYRRALGEWPEAACAENTRGSGSWVSLVPRAEKPDF